MAESNKNTGSQYLPLTMRTLQNLGVDSLEIGKTYYHTSYRREELNGPTLTIYNPVKVIGSARRGVYGPRVSCDDGLDRYQIFPYMGRNRVDGYNKNLSYKDNPDYIPEMTPHVQLSLFDF